MSIFQGLTGPPHVFPDDVSPAVCCPFLEWATGRATVARALCILHTNLVPGVCFANVSPTPPPPICGLSFYFLIKVFGRIKTVSLDEIEFVNCFFLFSLCFFVPYLRNPGLS